MGQWLSERLGQSFVIEEPDGCGRDHCDRGGRAVAPDGYTLLLTGQHDTVNATLYDKVNFEFLRESRRSRSLIRQPLILAVHPSLPARTLREFIAYAKANPGKISVASAGNGTAPHLAAELFKLTAGVDMVHVPYRGGAPAVTDLLGGRVQAMMLTALLSIEHIKTGALRALAVTSAERSKSLPDVPTVGDDLPGYEVNYWVGIRCAPQHARRGRRQPLNASINAGLADAGLQARFADMDGTPLRASTAEFQKFVADDVAKWAKCQAAGIRPD